MNIKFSESTINYFGQDKLDSALKDIKKKFGDIDCFIPISVSISECLYVNGSPVLNNAGHTSLVRGLFDSLTVKVQLNEIYLCDSKLSYETLLHEMFHAVEMSALLLQMWYDEETKEILVKDLASNTTTVIDKKYRKSVKYHDSLAFESRAISFAKEHAPQRSFMEKIKSSYEVFKAVFKKSAVGFGISFSLESEVAFTSEDNVMAVASLTPFKL